MVDTDKISKINPTKKQCVFLTDMPKSYLFSCALARRDADNLDESEKEKFDILCETFQNCVFSVSIAKSIAGSEFEINVINSEVPNMNGLLFNHMEFLYGYSSKCLLYIYNFNCMGEEIHVERYVVEDIICTLVRNYTATDVQKFTVSGKIDREIQ